MSRLISQMTVVATKKYQCNSSLFLEPCLYDIMDELTFSEKRAIVKARNNGWNIMPGEKYLSQFGEFEGEVFRVKCIPAIHDICVRLQLYQQ